MFQPLPPPCLSGGFSLDLCSRGEGLADVPGSGWADFVDKNGYQVCEVCVGPAAEGS